jgi:hypothetical protein
MLQPECPAADFPAHCVFSITRMLLALLLFLVTVFVPSPKLAGQQPPPPHCAQNLFCLFNQEAAATDPEGIHKYSEDLIEAIVPNPAGDDSVRQFTNDLVDRLTKAEQTSRPGYRGKRQSRPKRLS